MIDAQAIKALDEIYQNPNLFIDGLPYHQPFFNDKKFKQSQMISDVCSALLVNPAIESQFCLSYLSNEENALEAYQF